MKSHIIPKNEKTKIPAHTVYFDTEARISDTDLNHYHQLTCAIFGDEERIYKGKKLNGFWEDLDKYSRYKKTYVFAHNITYDILVSNGIIHLNDLGWSLKFFTDSQPQIYKFKKGKQSIEFISTTNFFSASLKKLGEMAGINKLETDYYSDEITEQYIEYCLTDVRILKTVTEQYFDFILKNDLGNFKATIASQAMRAFRHKFMKHEIYIHNNKDAIALEREAYMGGRTEAFRLGQIKEKVYILDVNSMYPFVMSSMRVPVRLEAYIRNPLMSDMKEYLTQYLVIARVILKTKNTYSKRVANKLCFVTGEFETTLCSPDLIRAFENGEIEEVLEVSLYDSRVLFKDYVEFFYNKRLDYKAQNNNIYQFMCKLFLNSLYGKFGQKKIEVTEIENLSGERYGYRRIYNFDTRKMHTEKIINYVAYQETDTDENANESFVAIAAFITAYARDLLRQYIEKAGKENVYYCDTDSLFVNKQGLDNLKDFIDNKKLGLLKVENETESLQINNLKDYTYNDMIKLKGISKGAKKIAEDLYSQKQWIHLGKYLENGCKYANYMQEKKLRREYGKGYVRDNVIYPYEFTRDGYQEILLHSGEIKSKDILKLTEEYLIIQEEKYKEKMIRQKKYELARQIISLGGINDESYNDILPSYLKSKKHGRDLEEICESLFESPESIIELFNIYTH